MPTIVKENGCRIIIYFNDHNPPHVHALKAGKEARVYLDPVSLWDSNMKPNDTKQAVEIVENNRDILLNKWYEIHGTNESDEGITE
ncbi:MAG: DUF4160 domain-containing protein [Chloroflexota bacterium]